MHTPSCAMKHRLRYCEELVSTEQWFARVAINLNSILRSLHRAESKAFFFSSDDLRTTIRAACPGLEFRGLIESTSSGSSSGAQ